MQCYWLHCSHYTIMVAKHSETGSGSVSANANSNDHSIVTTQAQTTTSAKKDETDTFSQIREALQAKGVPDGAPNIILQSWRTSTKQQYHRHINKWILFQCCSKLSETYGYYCFTSSFAKSHDVVSITVCAMMSVDTFIKHFRHRI